jgi:hypothetical protein
MLLGHTHLQCLERMGLVTWQEWQSCGGLRALAPPWSMASMPWLEKYSSASSYSYRQKTDRQNEGITTPYERRLLHGRTSDGNRTP